MRFINILCVAILILLTAASGQTETKSCDFNVDFDKNLEFLLEWCQKHRKSDNECSDLLDLAGQLPEKEFHNRVYQHFNSKPDKSSIAPSKDQLQLNWTQIPHEPKAAFQHLTHLSSLESNGFTKSVEFAPKAGKYFDSLNPAEVKHLYEIVEKMKTSPNRLELEKFLKTKGEEYLRGNKSRNCSGKNVISLRLSQGARMCFQFDSESKSSIKILCVGQGNRCYDH